MNDFLHLGDAGQGVADAPPIDGRAPIGTGVSSLVIAEAVRSAAGLPLTEGARLLIGLALTGTGWAAGALAGPGPARTGGHTPASAAGRGRTGANNCSGRTARAPPTTSYAKAPNRKSLPISPTGRGGRGGQRTSAA